MALPLERYCRCGGTVLPLVRYCRCAGTVLPPDAQFHRFLPHVDPYLLCLFGFDRSFWLFLVSVCLVPGDEHPEQQVRRVNPGRSTRSGTAHLRLQVVLPVLHSRQGVLPQVLILLARRRLLADRSQVARK